MNSRLAGLLATSLTITCAIAAALPAAAPALAAATGTCQSWSGAQPPSPGTDDNQLNSVAVLSPCDAWTVGSSESGERQTLIEHWNGGAWTVLKSPDPGTDDVLYGVTAISATDIWAVGDYVDGSVGKTLIVHWNGHSWTKVPSPNPSPDNNALISVSASSSSNAWAVGTFESGTSAKTLTVHWNGRTWTKVTSPDPSQQKNTKDVLNSVTVTSPSNAWAVGELDTSTSDQTLILHWNGRSWTKVASPNPAPNASFLTSVAATSAGNVWAVGGFFTRGNVNRTLILHWDGRSWRQVSSPNPGGAKARDTLASVTALSASSAWAVGSYEKGNSDNGTVLILHWNGRAWKSVIGPTLGPDNELFSVSASSASNLWAVGDYSAGGSDQTLAFHCC